MPSEIAIKMCKMKTFLFKAMSNISLDTVGDHRLPEILVTSHYEVIKDRSNFSVFICQVFANISL